MENVLELDQQEISAKSSRRSALLMGGAALAGLALTRGASAQSASAPSDADILNFALNLEYLEAQFYSYAVNGGPIPANSLGSSAGTVTIKSGNTKVNFTTPQLQAYAMETATDELNHVNFLRGALNANNANVAVSMPNIDLMNSFNTLAMAAGLGNTFDPFDGTELSFLLGAFIFEDVGVTAYHGAAGLITDKTYLDKAAGILAVEAYHAGSIRTQLYRTGAAAVTAANMIAAARAKLDGTNTDDIGPGTVSGGNITVASIVDADANAIAFSRTTTQVLNVVYGSTGSTPTPGVFFPMGLNGNIK